MLPGLYSLREFIEVPLSTLKRFWIELLLFYNSDDVNMIAAKLWLTTTSPISFYVLLETMSTDVNEVLKTKC